VPIVVLNQDCTIRTVNNSFRELAQMESTELEGRSLPDLAKLLWGLNDMRDRLTSLLESPHGTMVEFEHTSATPRAKMLLIKAQTLSTEGSPVLLLMMEDITLRRETEQLLAKQKEALESEIEIAARQLNRTQEELRGLTAHLFTMQEEERQRVARELHDDISQRLSLLEIVLEELRDDGIVGEDLARLKSAREQVHKLNTDVRQISHHLHPAILNDLGLSAALKSMVTEFGERENTPVTYLTRNLPEDWSPEAATAVFRIAQEALRNVAKHAGKTHVKVVLSGSGKRLQLRVMDFGVGFDQEMEGPARGLGMISMQERARLAGGTLTVQSSLGQGTTVTAEVPLDRHA